MVKLNNKRGSALLISCLLVMVLTIIAGAFVLCGTTEGKIARRHDASTQAFWLADGAVQRALYALSVSAVTIPTTSPVVLSAGSNELGEGHSYTVSYYSDPSSNNRWDIFSTGTVNNLARNINAEIGKYDIESALTSSGNVTTTGNISTTGAIEQNAAFSFESVFHGWTYQDVCQQATHKYPGNINCSTGTGTGNNNYKNSSPINGVTIINFDSNQSNLSLNSGSGLVIVDSTTSTKPTPTVSINGSVVFSGVIWIIGNTTINGNGQISGAIFVNGAATLGNGNATITYDMGAINSAVNNLGSSFTAMAPYVIDWKEN